MKLYQKVLLYLLLSISLLILGIYLIRNHTPQIDQMHSVEMFGDTTGDITDPCCTVLIYEDHPPEGNLYLCGIHNYIAMYTPTKNDCIEPFRIKVGATVTFTTLNKIVGHQGDVNLDGYFGREDIIEFLNCYNGIGTSTCMCYFDYNKDGKLDLFDVQQIQLAAGTGNSVYWASLNGTN